MCAPTLPGSVFRCHPGLDPGSSPGHVNLICSKVAQRIRRGRPLIPLSALIQYGETCSCAQRDAEGGVPNEVIVDSLCIITKIRLT